MTNDALKGWLWLAALALVVCSPVAGRTFADSSQSAAGTVVEGNDCSQWRDRDTCESNGCSWGAGRCS
jgi:hypothetical protein